MKKLIYQYWDGNIKESCRAGVENMKVYADKVGADYVFEENPQWIKKSGMDFGNYSAHYGAFKPVFNKRYRDYDYYLFCDTDVFTVEHIEEDIFEGFDHHIGICEEPFQPKQRQITLGRITSEQDEKWAQVVENAYGFKVPRTDEGLVKVFNSGVVLYSREGMQWARDKWVPFKKYVELIRKSGLDSFYTCDQPYLHAMIWATRMEVQIMDNKWNSYIHGTRDKENQKKRILDWRTPESNFVHCQFPGADNLDGEQLWKIVNLPREEWGYDI